jgi:nucleotide-binding universal stress UspA family protein
MLLERASRQVALRARTAVLEGEPAQQLILLAEREEADLLVVGVADESPVHPHLLGSVYLALAAGAPCPVVVVPCGVRAMPLPTGSVLGVAVGSEPAQAAGETAAHLADRLRAHLVFRRISARPTENVDVICERVRAAAQEERAQLVVLESRSAYSDSWNRLGRLTARIARSADRPVVLVPTTAQHGLPHPERGVPARDPERSREPERREHSAG